MKTKLLVFLLVIGLLQSEAARRKRIHRPQGRRRLITRVTYTDDRHHHPATVHTVIRHKKRRRLHRPVTLVPAESIHPLAGFQGSYVAVSGTPGRGAIHVVENVPSLRGESVTVVNGVTSISHGRPSHPAVVPHPHSVPRLLPHPLPHPLPVPHPVVLPDLGHPLLARPVVQPSLPSVPEVSGDRLPLPKCSYINTDFVGDELFLEPEDGEGKRDGINAGSARACKSRCRIEKDCLFWSYKEGFSRDLLTTDCFLKEGTPGLPFPREAVPRLGFVSGTKDNNCVCIKDELEEDEVCPIKEPRGLVYPWRSMSDEENDLEKGLPPLGWNRGVYGALDPRLGPIVGDPLSSIGGNNILQAQVKVLRDQLNLLTSKLGGTSRVRARARLEEAPYEDFSEDAGEERDFTDI